MRGRWFVVSSVVGVAFASMGACTPPVNPAGEPLRAPGTGEAFEGVPCSAVRPQTEPDLMAWDPGSRANLSRLRRRGVVAVRYQAKGCNVELELLSNCIGTTGKYEFAPYSANEKKVAHNASELFAELPVGAARLSGKVKGNRALRTDYMLAGQYALPPEATFKRADLQGTDCGRATHVVSALYVGAFAMAAGEQRAMEGQASMFGLGAGGGSQAEVEVLGDEGDAEACRASQKERKESDGCGVPLRVGLAALDAPTAPACPEGSVLQGDKCVRKNVVTEVQCPGGTRWDGSKCAASVDTNCARGLHFEAGRGCVPDAAQAAVVAPTAPTARAPEVTPGTMVQIPAGDFWMGSNDGDADVKPVHRVHVNAFQMDMTEVTVTAYAACVSVGVCRQPDTGGACTWGKSDTGNHPINCVSWNDASTYCDWTQKRLPTEEEWEYAARGTDGRRYPWGDADPGAKLCWNRRAGHGTCPVGNFPAGRSPFGLFDMAGNVWEWTSSEYAQNNTLVYRGGCFFDDAPAMVRSATRGRSSPSARDSTLGFRCAR